MMKSVLNECYSQHKYLRHSEIIQKEALIKEFDKYYINYEQLSEEDVVNGLKKLSKMLYVRFEKKSIILLDEYDAPINNSFIKCSEEVSQRVIDIMSLINL